MALVLKDRVVESSTSTGTGTFTLLGAETGYQSFSVIGDGNTTYYTIQGKDATGNLTNEWEVGVGTYNANTLSRDTVLESSNANAKVVFSAGAKDIFCDLPAEYALFSGVTSVSGTSPIASSGGTTPAISISQATASTNGYLSSTDWNTFNSKLSSQVYPSAGIANSTGTAWGTSYSTSGTGTVLALATGATINNATIGATTPSTGAFTYLSTSSSTSTTPVLSFSASNSNFAMGATISGSYLQTVLQNKSGTAEASTNYVLSNDLGTDSTYYGEFGMNASVYSSGTPSDFFSLNNGVYFSAHDGDVTIGSGNGYKTYFAWGTSGNSAHVINASGAIGLNTNITGTTNFGINGQVLTSAGSSATPTWATPTTPTPRIVSTASSSSITIDASVTDQYEVTALAVGTTFNAPTGSPSDGQKLTIRIKDNGTIQTIAWNAIFRVIGTTLFTSTVASKTFYVGCIYNVADTKWDVVSVAQQV